MNDISRRTVVLGAAWSVPVIMAAVAVPLAAASTVPDERVPISCTLLNGTGSPYYQVAYNDGTTETLHRSEVATNKTLKALCKVPANGNEGL